MENWDWSAGKSADELAAYQAYALQILKNIGLPCEGVTTPGGYGSRNLPELSQATLQSVRDVFGAEIPHYFRHTFTDDRSVAPRVEYASGLDSSDPRCVVSIKCSRQPTCSPAGRRASISTEGVQSLAVAGEYVVRKSRRGVGLL